MVEVVLTPMMLALLTAAWYVSVGRSFVATPVTVGVLFIGVAVVPGFVFARLNGVTTGVGHLFVLLLAIGSLTVGVTIGRAVLRGSVIPISVTHWRKHPHPADHVFIIALAVLLCAGGIVFYGGLPATVTSVIGLLTGKAEFTSALGVRDARLALTKGAYFDSAYRGQGLVSVIQFLGWSIISAYAVIVRARWWVLLMVLLLSWIFVAGDGQRAPYLMLLSVVVIALSWRRRLRFRHVLLGSAAFLIAAVALGLYSTKMFAVIDEGIAAVPAAASDVVQRATMGNSLNDVRVIDLERRGLWELRLGEIHYRNFANALPGVRMARPLSYELFVEMNPWSEASTYWSGTYLGTVYIDFGGVGIFVLYLLIGVLLMVLQWGIFRSAGGPIASAFAAVIVFLAGTIFFRGPYGFLANMAVVGILWAILIAFRGLHVPHRGGVKWT